jgi:hypothetical protein
MLIPQEDGSNVGRGMKINLENTSTRECVYTKCGCCLCVPVTLKSFFLVFPSTNLASSNIESESKNNKQESKNHENKKSKAKKIKLPEPLVIQGNDQRSEL